MKPANVATTRIVTGTIQGVILYFLFQATKNNTWPADDPQIFGTLSLISIIVPLLIMLNLGSLRGRTILAWALCATTLLIALACHEFTRRSGLEYSWNWFGGSMSSLSLIAFVIVGFFIAQSLIIAGGHDRTYIATYSRYFDDAWKLTIQLIFSLCFAQIFWIALWTGAALFALIKLDFVLRLISKSWFSIPVTAMAFAYAIHLTDVRPGLVGGIRTLKLILLSWLLPIMTLFAAGFVLMLPFQGLAILWKTHHTSQILLGMCAWLILLINAAYQDGAPEHLPGRVLRISGKISAVLLLPLTILAVFAVIERTQEFGWTVFMIEVMACLVITACYAVGYFAAAMPGGAWLYRLEKTNIYTAFVILIVLLALFTPIADPARLSVVDQMHRLDSGKITLEKFDFAYLRRSGEQYGVDALNSLKNRTADPKILDKIAEVTKQNRYGYTPPPPPKPEDINADITVYPQGRVLPDVFAKQNWAELPQEVRWQIPKCLYTKNDKCEAIMIDASKDSPQELILMSTGSFASNVALFKAIDDTWTWVGNFSHVANCKGMREALRAGKFNMAAAAGQDIVINGRAIQLQQNEKCPP